MGLFNRKKEADVRHPSDQEDPQDPGTGTRVQVVEAEAEAEAEPDIEVVESDKPLVGYRSAGINLALPSTPFTTVSSNGAFGIVTRAVCNNSSGGYYSGGSFYPGCGSHLSSETPSPGCSCGFYAVVDPTDCYPGDNYVELVVELSGTVLEHEGGYRAEYQKVVGVRVPPCPYCAGATALALVAPDMLVTRFVCRKHTVEQERGWLYVDIPSLSHRLGVPVIPLEIPKARTSA